jgi:hypothetical protein
MSEIMAIKPTLHFIFPNDSKFGVRNLFAGITSTARDIGWKISFFISQFFTGLSLRLRADISMVKTHETADVDVP